LRRAVLALPPHGYLNIHPSLLPLYRGPTPVSSAILAGDQETGVSVMRLSAKMDAGPILAQRRVPLAPDARTGPLTDQLFELGAALLLEVLPPYIAGTLQPLAQDDAQATYTSLLTRSSGQVDWHLPAVQIERMTRAYDPWPGVTTTLRGQPLRIGRVELVPDSPAGMQPGQLREERGSVLVATGQGMLRLLEVQPSGKRLMPAADWLRGLRTSGPVVLGDTAEQAR
ncbi:MAG TPA: methionyl-tRNA formyltransferase, partial [Roseiflexaceae bacterium]|nr:methionyl-tRNA formyltransferase [Roseiflexaceae bacterium]